MEKNNVHATDYQILNLLLSNQGSLLTDELKLCWLPTSTTISH
jgi:hypothetical protein